MVDHFKFKKEKKIGPCLTFWVDSKNDFENSKSPKNNPKNSKKIPQKYQKPK